MRGEGIVFAIFMLGMAAIVVGVVMKSAEQKELVMDVKEKCESRGGIAFRPNKDARTLCFSKSAIIEIYRN